MNRSMRDGLAVRAEDLPGEFMIAGEVRAGDTFNAGLQPGQAVEIMTGAPVPRGADSVVMIEQTTVVDGRVSIARTLSRGENVTLQGSEAKEGDTLLEPGTRLGFGE